MSDTTNTAEMAGLPDPNTAREGALERLRWTIDTLVQQAKDEAFSDLALCIESVKQQVGRLAAFDRALVDLLPEHERDDAARFLRNRDAASLWTPTGGDEDVPF